MHGASYSVLVKFKPASLSSFEFFVTIVAMGMVMLLPFVRGIHVGAEIGILRQFYWAIAYVVIYFDSFILSVAQGITHLGADRTGQFTHLMPVFGSFLAYLF